MQSWMVTKLGEPKEALEIREIPQPSTQENEVLIKVEATALNFFDILLCKGEYQQKPDLPFTPGAEICGTISTVGDNSKFKVGQRVIAKPDLPNGGLTEWVSVPEASVFVIPDNMPASEAAALFMIYQTSYYALYHRGELKADDVLLVHAGAGGVGSAAIQLGKARGAKVIATAGGPEKVKVCKELGADLVIDYLTEDFIDIVKKETNGGGADVIFDPVGSDTFDKSRKCIAFDGRLLVVGFAGGRIPETPAGHVLVKNYSVVGVHWGLFRKKHPEKVQDIHEDLMKLYAQGVVKPLVFKEYDFKDVPAALDELGDRKTYGKLIIKR